MSEENILFNDYQIDIFLFILSIQVIVKYIGCELSIWEKPLQLTPPCQLHTKLLKSVKSL